MHATPAAREVIARIEAELTGRYQSNRASIADVDLVDMALSLAGLMVTVSSDENVACIQDLNPTERLAAHARN